MYQRQQRQNLGGTSVNSPFFTTHQPNSYQTTSSSAADYGGYGGGSSYSSQQSAPAASSSYHYGNTNTGSSSYYGGDDGATSSRSPKSKSSSSAGGISYLVFLIWTVMLLTAAYGYIQWVALPKQRIHDVQVEEKEVEEIEHQWKKKYHDLKASHSQLQERMKSSAEGAERGLKEVRLELTREQKWALEWKEKAVGLETTYENLKRAIQEVSRRQVLHKFGPGPFRIELEIQMDGTELAYITMELAPLEEMPHTLWFFLNQIDQGLYNHDDFGFRFNAPHVIQASPAFSEAAERLHRSGLGEVLVTEYSPAFPHQVYSVGLSGRPGGPDFYINIVDNSQWHGPGGYATDGSGDACFGRITRGQEIIDRIHGMTGPLEKGDWKEMRPATLIRSMKIL